MSDETRERSDTSSAGSTAVVAGAQMPCASRHLRFGWWSVLFFLSWGVVLEGLQVFGTDFYGQPEGEMSRLMWRLAHVHGALLGLVHIAFGASVFMVAAWTSSSRRIASYCLMLASALLPAGFLLGGVFASGGDPSLGVALVPVGALLLFAGVLLTARGLASVQ